MTIAWIDAGVGASGDMLLGALVDAGVPLAVLQAAVAPLEVGISFRAEPVHRSALGATKVHVDVPTPQRLRHLPDILKLLARLPSPLADGAGQVFIRLGEAEAAVHRVPVEAVHFHEVGALDCIADIVGVVAGMAYLGSSRIVCSPVGLGQGFANTEHGRIPVPVPAVLQLLAGAPTSAGPAKFESTTPTGAALLASLATEWGPMPPMSLDRVGTGAGTRDDPDLANVVRIVVGAVVNGAQVDGAEVTAALQLEANVDDLDPRVWPVAIQAILDAGADDAWVAPITMKKGRPAFTVSALCDPVSAGPVRAAFFEHTTTIGLREYSVAKRALDRQEVTVQVEGHPIRVKLAFTNGAVINRSVEWDDVAAASEALQWSPKQVLRAATALAAVDPT